MSLGDHGFNGRSDARYAIVSQEMISSHDWLVPHYMGRVHLTKPPLVYWLQAASIELFGKNFLAVRIPSAISGTLTILLLYCFMNRLRGRQAAIFACGLYAIMPLTIFTSRMTVTDSTLNLCWTMTLSGAYLAGQVAKHRRLGLVLVWFGAAVGMFTKGPVMFIPMGIVLTWWALTRRETPSWKRSVAYTIAGVGTLIPILTWAVLVIVVEPDAAGIWWHETFDRAIGQGDHARPIWYFIPVLVAGCFPCSAMLVLPGINLRFRAAWAQLRSGSLEGFLGYAIIVTFVVYSLISGKLPSYLLPICAPLSMLSAIVLSRWFSEQRPSTPQGQSLPEVRLGMLIGTCLFTLGAATAIFQLFNAERLIFVIGLLPALLLSMAMVRYWSVLHLRMPLTAAFIVSWVLGWLVLLEIEDIALAKLSFAVVARETFGQQGWQGRVGAYQLDAGILYWERGGAVEQYTNAQQLAESLSDSPLLVLTREDRWQSIKQSNNELYLSGHIKHEWRSFPGMPTRYLVVFNETSTPHQPNTQTGPLP